MQISYGDQAEDRLGEGYAGRGKDFRKLLLGREQAPDNYRVVLSRVNGRVYRPRHRHIFDQIRLCISGEMNFGKNRNIHAGEVAYFPEGTPYGPEQCEASDRLGVTIQFGGPSGLGFPSEREMQVGFEALQKQGVFEDGIFKRRGPAPDQRRNQDAHEAVLEYIRGGKITYPEMRYDDPVLIRPQSFQWAPLSEQPGVSTKKLGVFTERIVEIDEIRIEPSARHQVSRRAGIRIYFVLSGTGHAEDRAGRHEIRPLTAFEIAAGDSASITADTALEIFVLGLPIFATQRADLAAE